jgi:hypothetical protein
VTVTIHLSQLIASRNKYRQRLMRIRNPDHNISEDVLMHIKKK